MTEITVLSRNYHRLILAGFFSFQFSWEKILTATYSIGIPCAFLLTLTIDILLLLMQIT